ncbi:MAG: glycine cleavage system aminomethyltransferase GcvT [Candidatus Omnitrophica bacterium]|jgi:aminomethyltransferase|nr:glycine cleavage system aminomethyltransferase GcvT [Candidatus Omnitrophota bacterium]
MEPKKTPLYQKHVENNAHIVDFSGWALPIEYSSILKETKAVRLSCGLFDASHMGEIIIRGTSALDFLQALTPNDISKTNSGQLQYNVFLNEKAGIIDDLMVYNLGNSFLCVVNASNINKVYTWLCRARLEAKYVKADNVEIVDESPEISLLSLQGPKSVKVISEIFGQDINSLKYMHFVQLNFENKNIIVSRSGYTGEDGFELYCPNCVAPALWDVILEKGKSHDLCLCGLGARDVLRIEAGYPLYGHEINDNTNPLEASLNWVVKFKKDFIAKDKLENAEITRMRVGFVMNDRAIARQGYSVYSNDKIIGQVTSGTFSPNLDKFIGMAYVEKEFGKIGTSLEIKIRDKFYKAQVANFNFIKHR